MSTDHEMKLVNAYPSGATEWECLECDRRLILQFTPYKKIVIVKGDEKTSHHGSVGMEGMNISFTKLDAQQSDGDPRLDVWKKALGNIDLGDER